jgi:integrase
MPVSRITQRFVDDLLGAEAPAKDEFYWSERMPGFGVKHRAGSGSISYVVQWREKGDRSLGKSHRLSLGNAAQVRLEAAERVARERLAEVMAGKNPIQDRRRFRESPTFRGLIDTYLASRDWRRKAPTTRDFDLGRIHAFLLPALGSKKVVDITLGDLRNLHRDLCDPAKAEALAKAGGRTKATRRGGEGGARRTMRLLKAILAFAVEEFDLPENPAAKLKLDADGERDVVPDLDAYGRLWAAIEKLRGTSYTMTRACDCIALIALTGARRGEIKGLRRRHVDLPGRRLVLAKDEHKAGRKTGKTRIIGLPADAVAILTTYLPKEGEKFPEPDALVFSGLRPDAPVALQKPWEAIAEEAKLPSTITLHSLRHGVGTLLAAQGKSPAQLAMALGHSQWRTTERYVHAVDFARAELAEETAALVRPNKLRTVT